MSLIAPHAQQLLWHLAKDEKELSPISVSDPAGTIDDLFQLTLPRTFAFGREILFTASGVATDRVSCPGMNWRTGAHCKSDASLF